MEKADWDRGGSGTRFDGNILMLLCGAYGKGCDQCSLMGTGLFCMPQENKETAGLGYAWEPIEQYLSIAG